MGEGRDREIGEAGYGRARGRGEKMFRVLGS